MLIILSILTLLSFILYWQLYAKRKRFPPGPTPWPFLGNIPQINYVDMHKDLIQWKKQYGGVFTIWLPIPHVIISDYESLKEYFVKKGEIFAGRPYLNIFRDFLGSIGGLIINDNSFYKSQRRYAIHVLRDFGMGRAILQDTVIDQAKKMVQLLEDHQCAPLDLAPYFTNAVGNVIFQLIFGYVREFTDPEIHMFKKNLDEIVEAFASPIGLLMELSPKFKQLDPLFGGGYMEARKKNDEILDYLKKEIEEHKKTVDYESEPRDYIDAFLQEIRRREKENRIEEFTEEQLLLSIYDLFGAGVETTATISRTFILYLLHYPEVQAKIHAELDNVIGRENLITMSDQTKLPYLNAAIQEIQRITILLPLGPLHVVLEDVCIGEYTIPKGTMVIPQFNSVHLDEELYPDPECFDPERHLDKNGALRKDDRIMPFSLGKRACLGESLAKMELFLLLSHLLQKFEFRKEIVGRYPPLEYAAGFVRGPKTFKCRAVPRK